MLTISLLIACACVVGGLLVLVWSADRFVDGAAATARHFGMPMLLVGMVIIGFGTSAPEMVVSAIAALQGNPGVALGNAYGSNIANIGLILGVTALLSPVAVAPQILRRELPILLGITLFAVWQVRDGSVTRAEAVMLLLVFGGLMAWTIWRGLHGNAGEGDSGEQPPDMPLGRALLWLVVGLGLLVLSSRLLVWGAVEIARGFGVSDLVIGLTIVAIGTSLPELASSVAAARKGENDIAIGNVIGSNFFNTLAVVGIAGAISPMQTEAAVWTRDVPAMLALTVLLFAFGFKARGQGQIGRLKGVLLLAGYVGYSLWLAGTAFAH